MHLRNFHIVNLTSCPGCMFQQDLTCFGRVKTSEQTLQRAPALFWDSNVGLNLLPLLWHANLIYVMTSWNSSEMIFVFRECLLRENVAKWISKNAPVIVESWFINETAVRRKQFIMKLKWSFWWWYTHSDSQQQRDCQQQDKELPTVHF